VQRVKTSTNEFQWRQQPIKFGDDESYTRHAQPLSNKSKELIFIDGGDSVSIPLIKLWGCISSIPRR
jgi:hypothetical protein